MKFKERMWYNDGELEERIFDETQLNARMEFCFRQLTMNKIVIKFEFVKLLN